MVRRSRRAFHLELRDSYHVVQEDEPFARWLAGEPDDYAWRQDWLSFVREVTAGGTRIERLRVITEPPSDYVRWEHALDPQNIAVGEEIRYLPRQVATDVSWPAEDCWLLDDDQLILSLFKPDGRSAGFAIEDAPDLVVQYRAVRDIGWPRGMPSAEYVSK
jgi:hypothetical protein